jgi:hypothetical protein
MVVDPIAAVVIFALVLLVWITALIPRAVVSDRHIWSFTVAFFAFFALLLLVMADQRSF